MSDDNERTITCSVCGCVVHGVCTHLGLAELSEALADVARLTRERDDARTVLRRYRWDDSGPYRVCAACRQGVEDGCADDCEIARALGERKEGG